jgi:hypothetical protein
MRRWCAAGACACAVAACGDDAPSSGPRVVQADTMVIVAHFDDDMIFMQPELLHALASGSVTTVYITSGDSVHGNDRAEHTFESAMTAYGSVIGASLADWDCGYVPDDYLPIHHCRARTAPVSMIGLDVPDGGIDGAFADSLLHLVEGRVATVPILGLVGGRATADQIIDELAQLVMTTNPSQIHALDLAATHGRDHSSHMFTSSFAFWAAARTGYAGAFTWHRGYNVADQPITLGDADFAAVAPMLGFFEACYFGCGSCGTPCPIAKLDASHVTWLARQYSYARAPAANGALGLAGTASCLAASGGAIALEDCSAAPAMQLDPTGHLALGGQCVASADDGSVALAPCAIAPEQYWLLDSEGMLWNGRTPAGADGMDYDHVRCLSIDPQPGATPTAPTCGEHLQPRWTITP